MQTTRSLENQRLKNQPMSHYSYFAGAPEDEFVELERIRTIHHFKDGKRIPFTFDGRVGFYFLHQGYVKVIGGAKNETKLIRIAGPGDLLGYARWLAPEGNYGFVSLSNVTVSFFAKDDFLKLQERSPFLTSEVIHWLTKVLLAHESRIFSLTNSNAKVRVAGALYELRKSFGNSIGGSDAAAATPIDRKTLAELCGVANEVLSRVLGDFEKDGIIVRNGRVIVIADIEGLEKAATC